jgi:hypothetical protein
VLLLDSICDDGGAAVCWFICVVGVGLDGRCCWSVAGMIG